MSALCAFLCENGPNTAQETQVVATEEITEIVFTASPAYYPAREPMLREFEELGVHPSKRFFGLLHHLEDALGCEVDLLTASGLRNLYFRRKVLKV